MKFYDVFMKPLELLYLKRIRQELLPQVSGDVLEIGFGTGANMPFYQNVKLNALDLKLDKRNHELYPEVNFIEANAAMIPLEDHSMDFVVATLVFCSIDDVVSALKEVKRVLKPEGSYIFLEHVLPRNRVLATLFQWFNPYWYKMSACNLNRDTEMIIKKEGFQFTQLDQKALSIFKYGIAVKALIENA